MIEFFKNGPEGEFNFPELLKQETSWMYMEKVSDKESSDDPFASDDNESTDDPFTSEDELIVFTRTKRTADSTKGPPKKVIFSIV